MSASMHLCGFAVTPRHFLLFAETPNSTIVRRPGLVNGGHSLTIRALGKMKVGEKPTIGYEWWALRTPLPAHLQTPIQEESKYYFPLRDGKMMRFSQNPNVNAEEKGIVCVRRFKGEELLMSYDSWRAAVHGESKTKIQIDAFATKNKDGAIQFYIKNESDKVD